MCAPTEESDGFGGHNPEDVRRFHNEIHHIHKVNLALVSHEPPPVLVRTKVSHAAKLVNLALYLEGRLLILARRLMRMVCWIMQMSRLPNHLLVGRNFGIKPRGCSRALERDELDEGFDD